MHKLMDELLKKCINVTAMQKTKSSNDKVDGKEHDGIKHLLGFVLQFLQQRNWVLRVRMVRERTPMLTASSDTTIPRHRWPRYVPRAHRYTIYISWSSCKSRGVT